MLRATLSAPVLALLLLGCSSEDPRLPQKLYDDAVKLNQDGKSLEARNLMAMVAERYPQTTFGKQAREDMHLMEVLQKAELQEKTRSLRTVLKRTSDALKRYRTKKGEYPLDLAALVPEYLEQLPETAWGHPLFYRPFVGVPVEDVTDRRGRTSQKINRSFDRFYLACLGTDLEIGGKNLAGDVFIVDGEFVQEKQLPPLPQPQPVR